MNSLSTLTSQIEGTAPAGRGNRTLSAKELNDRFLRLLIAQMKNQDPLNPLDNAQVTSQMAQISTVTGVNGLTETVTKLLAQFERLETLQAAQLAGRTVLVEGRTLALAAEGAASGGFELNQPADRVTVEIRDGAGQLVRTLSLPRQEAGVARFDWDGLTDAGVRAAAGSYTFTVKAVSGNSEIAATALAARRVEGVRRLDGQLQLLLAGGGAAAYGDVRQIL
ncbi:MAG: flagellar hook assembly protein FlgD [Sutterellaceae bacterium]|nr:flagellar hook assembly protein FlgD [Burkholderiaceae bacterium]MCX7901905.1 flagellar hook assembly protein FlgD [Burkholderiaceae bacterium]MDW8429974.1 flagellar hook assembly protein FlgD [Sutterellaceae bacterium]